MAALDGIHIVSFIGRQGSGKTFLGQKLAQSLSIGRLEISEIVRALNKGLSRAELPSTQAKTWEDPDWLGREVEARILKQDITYKRMVVLTGVREYQVHRYLRQSKASISELEIYAEPYVRCERLMRLGKVASEEEFLAHEVRENSMGIKTLLQYAPVRIETSELSDPDDLIKQTLIWLKEKGIS